MDGAELISLLALTRIIMVTLRGLVRIIRPVNSVMMGFAVLVGAAIGGSISLFSSVFDLTMAFLTGFMLTASAMAVNDYYDRDIDAINEPERPIPSGSVTPEEALAFSGFLSVMGLIAAYSTSLNNLVIAVFAWIAMMTYSTVGKKTGLLGNIIVSVCISLPFIYGSVMLPEGNLESSLLFALIVFLANTGREVTKGIVDIEGDQALGVKTVAVSRGSSFAALVSVLCYLMAVAVSIFPAYLGLVSVWYIPFVAITDIGLVYLSISLIRHPNRENSRRVKNLVRYLMLSGLIGFLAGSLF